jgi:dTDP-4-amino-4,6-dideoxygalactose transaminase
MKASGHETMETAPFLPVASPLLPPSETLLPYLREIDAARIYSNYGPLTRRLESRLAARLGLPASGLSTVANATVGIALALQVQDPCPGSFCLMPAWTFAATAHAAVLAGMTPFLVDVDPATWAMEPEAALRTVRHLPRGSVGAALPVAPFGRPLDLAAWDAFAAKTGIPVVIDAAAGFDGLRSVGRSPVVVSLHATKALGAGEGGFVASAEPGFAEEIVRRTNFGFLRDRNARVAGTNAKLSEYHAAVGLAALDAWPATRHRLAAAAVACAKALAVVPGVRSMAGCGTDWISTTWVVEFDPPALAGLGAAAIDRIAAALEARGIGARRWWGRGLHRHDAFAGCPRGPLPVAEDLAERTLGLPFRVDQTPSEALGVAAALAEILAAGALRRAAA